MAITTYAELKTAVANWLARDDLTSRIPEFITLAEAKLNRELRCIQAEARATDTNDLSAAAPWLMTLPTDFQSMKRVRLQSVTGKPTLEFLSLEQAAEYRYSNADATGQPWGFAIFGSEMELVPTPDAVYTFEMIYRANIPALTASNTTNWLLTLAPDIYLYGALLEAAPYMRDPEQTALWSSAFKATLDSLNALSLEKRFNAPPMSVRIFSVTP